jgi:hypothetical protein
LLLAATCVDPIDGMSSGGDIADGGFQVQSFGRATLLAADERHFTGWNTRLSGSIFGLSQPIALQHRSGTSTATQRASCCARLARAWRLPDCRADSLKFRASQRVSITPSSMRLSHRLAETSQFERASVPWSVGPHFVASHERARARLERASTVAEQRMEQHAKPRVRGRHSSGLRYNFPWPQRAPAASPPPLPGTSHVWDLLVGDRRSG